MARGKQQEAPLEGWCYGPVRGEPQPGGEIVMWCTDWAEPGVPCPWEATAANTISEVAKGLTHAAKH
jgi:hypothetical protein